MSLDDQAEQLDNVEGNLDKINNDMAESEKAIKDMDRAFGIIPKFWKKNGGFKEDKETWAEAKPTKGFDKAEALEIRDGAFVAKITNDDREEEMEENMEQVDLMFHFEKKFYENGFCFIKIKWIKGNSSELRRIKTILCKLNC